MAFAQETAESQGGTARRPNGSGAGDPLRTASHDVEENVRAFVRAHPTASLVGAALLGFAAARLFRAWDSK